MSAQGPAAHAGAWDTYWRGTRESASHQEGGPQEPVLEAFWATFFAAQLGARATPSLLDLACGHGAVTGHALKVSPALLPHCSDYSFNALQGLQQRYPSARCIAADAGNTPFADGAFDLVVSQFGVEYAGPEALFEAARLVAPGGTLGLLLHLAGGAIYRECEHNRDTVRALRELDILSLARAAFDAGFALNAGTGSPEAFKAAERAFTPAVRGLEQLLQSRGAQSAGGLLQQLYQDIAHMYRRMSAYAPDDIRSWLDGMDLELTAYSGRMQSMLDAAFSQQAIDAAMQRLAADGFSLRDLSRLRVSAEAQPAAWALVMQRG
ncbi:class I SAM-dependent methyltransferase [Haliea salexigens]|uniref:class I SAM-dependent methyltransferase n=1 Tax=Haliea salexigens TaxID=287487 RepID=UPI00040EE032|nr:class I SAM-dependent methyltransferase [Haliea salexigens]